MMSGRHPSLPAYPDSGHCSRGGHALTLPNYDVRKRTSHKSETSTKPNNDDINLPPDSTKGLVVEWSDHTSLQGIPYIYHSRHLMSRVLWVLIFLGAVAATIYQLYTVFDKFYAYNTVSQVTIGYNTLPFPSITVCNINPIRVSEAKLGSQQLTDFLLSLAPRTEYQDSTENVTQPAYQQDGLGLNQEVKKRKKREINGPHTVSRDFLDALGAEQELAQYDDAAAIGGSSASRSASFIVDNQFYRLYTGETDPVRRAMGHQKETFILGCSFDGRDCSAANFSESLTPQYGNCYTFNSNDLERASLRSRNSGSTLGLYLILYIENHEYVQNYVHGSGIRLHIHPYNTLPFIQESGISVRPGVEAYIGMKMINMSRLGPPYSMCSDGGTFKKKYDHGYTMEACTNTCLDRTIVSECNCYRQIKRDIIPAKDLVRISPCASETELRCAYGMETKRKLGEITCDCNPSCNEVAYDIQISTHTWPDESLWYNMIESVCDLDRYGCWYLRNHDDEKNRIMKENFLGVRIFYRDLNFESIAEQAEYDMSQFLSDMGGTVGLYLGASAITGLEVLDLILQFIVYRCLGIRRREHRLPRQPYRY